MADIAHSTLTGADLHEPKGVAGASDNAIAQASSGAAVWSADLAPDTMILATPVYEDVKTVGSAFTKGGLNDPGWAKITDDGAGSQGVYAYHFDNGTEEELFFDVQLPHAYSHGTDIEFHVHWAASSAAAGNVVWGIEYVSSWIGDTIGNSTLATVVAAASGVDNKHQLTDIVTISGAAMKGSQVLNCRVYRKAADAGDTYGADAILLSADFHIQVDKLGSVTDMPS